MSFENRIMNCQHNVMVKGGGVRSACLALGLMLLSMSGMAQTSPLVFDWVQKTGLNPGRADQLRDSAVDSAGNVYLVGAASTTSQGLNFVTVKLSPTGQVLWTAEFDGAAHGDDTARSVDIDAQGDVYVTGSSINARGDTDIVVIRYTSSGALSAGWAAGSGQSRGIRIYDGPAQSYDTGVKVKVDANGFVFVLGSSVGSGTFSDIVLLKYNQLGDRLWTARYDGPAHSSDQPVFLNFMPSGNILVGGQSLGVNGDNDWVLLQFDQTGNYAETIWTDIGDGYGVRRFNYAPESEDVPTDAIVDASGNIYVAGTVNPAGGTTDMALIKVTPSGSISWNVRYDGGVDGIDQTIGLLQDPLNGDLVLGGTSDGMLTGADMILLRYTTNGVAAASWSDKGSGVGVRRYSTDGYVEDRAASLKMDGQGNLYLGGFTLDSVTQYDYLIPIYSRAGELWGVGRYDGGTSESERIINLHVDTSSHVVAIGNLFANNGDDELLAVRFGVKPLFDVTKSYVTALNGKTLALTVTPPSGTYTYQWLRNGQNVSGAQAVTYQINGVSLAQAGDYSLRVTNSYGITEFPVTELTVASLGWVNGIGTTISLAGASGASLSIEYANALSSNITWNSLTSVTLGAGTTSVSDSGASAAAQRFYRVRRVVP